MEFVDIAWMLGLVLGMALLVLFSFWASCAEQNAIDNWEDRAAVANEKNWREMQEKADFHAGPGY